MKDYNLNTNQKMTMGELEAECLNLAIEQEKMFTITIDRETLRIIDKEIMEELNKKLEKLKKELK